MASNFNWISYSGNYNAVSNQTAYQEHLGHDSTPFAQIFDILAWLIRFSQENVSWPPIIFILERIHVVHYFYE